MRPPTFPQPCPATRAAAATLVSLLATGALVRGADPDFSEGVRSTEPLSPEEQREKFHLPDGFVIELVAAEPQIAKPMNLAFDSRGKLWVTSSAEYPYAAPPDREARDHVHVLDDTDGDGRADEVVEFAGGLNIPIGVYPFDGGRSAVVWSIPNIWRLDDTDGDGRADRRTVLYGPLGEAVDTHGMQNGFTRGFDGWLYICHGFRNSSTVKGTDGSEITLESGNTYRVRLDGSRVEKFTSGQVNPFGLCFDPDGNAYTADCHSSPLYQLIRGGFYPSFGKPHDGLGFAPTLLQHTHGSTAICGTAYYRADSNWPEEFRDTLFVGNVMTSRVHRDQVRYTGSTPHADEMPDFLTCDDPWFRPVDLQFGPDGALYIADFYNRIIGHYEVPLDHPGRDRERGRIWRVRYTGAPAPAGDGAPRDLSTAGPTELVAAMGSPNLTRRMLATSELVDRFGPEAAFELREALDDPEPLRRAHALWALERVGELGDVDLQRAAADEEPIVRGHVMRVLGERPERHPVLSEIVVGKLRDRDPAVRRQAAAALGRTRWREPGTAPVEALAAALGETSPDDTHLAYTLKVALRDQLKRDPASFRKLDAESDLAPLFAAVARAIPSPEAARFLWSTGCGGLDGDPAALDPAAVRHAARYLLESDLSEFVLEVSGRGDGAIAFFRAVEGGLDERGRETGALLGPWADRLASHLLSGAAEGWQVGHKGEAGGDGDVPWVLQERQFEGREGSGQVLSSLSPGGESLTGTLRSPAFPAPATLAVYVCGHDGYPDQPAKGVNYVRVVTAEGGRELARAAAPRNDVARRFELDLGDRVGDQVRVEVVDGDTGDAYAWIGAAIEPPGPGLPSADLRDAIPGVAGAIRLITRYRLDGFGDRLLELAVDPEGALEVRREALSALATNEARRSGRAEVFSKIAANANNPPGLRSHAAELAVAAGADPGGVIDVLAVLPSGVQPGLAAAIARKPDGAEALLEAAAAGVVSPRLLMEEPVANAARASGLGGAAERIAERIAELTRDLPAADARIAELVAARQASLRQRGAGDAEKGAALFAQHCALCHQVAGEGNVVGPQLDGIGNRGLDRLVEDVLDPNRNVDHAFRLSSVELTDGSARFGLFRRQEGATLVFADVAGAEFAVREADVTKREALGVSLMPPVYADVFPEGDFADLVAFLLTLR